MSTQLSFANSRLVICFVWGGSNATVPTGSMWLASMVSGEPLVRSSRVFTYISPLDGTTVQHIEGRFCTNGGMQKRREDGPEERDGWGSGNEGVDPLADGRQRSRGIPVEIRNLTQGGPTRGGLACSRAGPWWTHTRWRVCCALEFLIQDKGEL